MKRLKFWLLVQGIIISNSLHGQTCCSGGTPLTGNLGIQGIESKSFYFRLAYEYNFLDDLYNERQLLEDKTRERLTQTILLQGI